MADWDRFKAIPVFVMIIRDGGDGLDSRSLFPEVRVLCELEDDGAFGSFFEREDDFQASHLTCPMGALLRIYLA